MSGKPIDAFPLYCPGTNNRARPAARDLVLRVRMSNDCPSQLQGDEGKERHRDCSRLNKSEEAWSLM